eukprot:2831776-Prymnesium_polylepis.1
MRVRAAAALPAGAPRLQRGDGRGWLRLGQPSLLEADARRRHRRVCRPALLRLHLLRGDGQRRRRVQRRRPRTSGL